MREIKVEHRPSPERLSAMGVWDWPIWEKEVSTFPWTYTSTEVCYLLEGAAVVTPQGGVPVRLGKGDLITFPTGMACVWNITESVRKHFNFA